MPNVTPKTGEFEEGKLWFSRKSAMLTVGLTDMATAEIGEIESVDLPSEGETYDEGDVIATIEGNHGQIEVTAPKAGVVREINEAVQRDPEIISDDPTDEGWLVRMQLFEVEEEAPEKDSEDEEEEEDDFDLDGDEDDEDEDAEDEEESSDD